MIMKIFKKLKNYIIIIITTIFIILTLCNIVKANSLDESTLLSSNFTYNTNEYDSFRDYSEENTKKVLKTQKVVDDANLFTEEEERELTNLISNFIETYNMDMVIVTINKNNKSSSMAYADDFYDYNDYGIGENKSGILFLMDMDLRNMWISTTGSAIKMYNDERIDKILDFTYAKIKNKKYFECAQEFINYSSYFAEKGVNGKNTVVTIKDVIFISIVITSISTAIFVGIGIYNQRTVRKQKIAKNYARNFKLLNKSDVFINRHTSKVYVGSSSSSGGGSSTHSSSSGSSHGGGGRSF